MSVNFPAKAQTRIAYIDAIRIVALFAIVIGHVYTENEFNDRLIQSWRLPIFFMLSGYFWSARRTMREEVGKRWRQLLVPYLWWLLLIASLSIPVRAMRQPETLGEAVTGVLLGGSFAKRPLTTFWFFTALFLSVLLYRYLVTLPAWLRLSVVAAGLGVNMLFGANLASIPYSAGTALGAMVFLEAGRAVRLARDKQPELALRVAAAVCFAAAVALLLIPGDFVPIDMKKGQFPPLGILVALLIGCALVLAATSLPRMGERPSRWLTLAATPSLSIIMLHPLVLWVLRPESGKLPLWLVTAAAFVVPLALGLVLMRTRLAQPLLGIPQLGPKLQVVPVVPLQRGTTL